MIEQYAPQYGTKILIGRMLTLKGRILLVWQYKDGSTASQTISSLM